MNDDKLSFSTVLGIENSFIPELRRFESLLYEFHQEQFTDEKLLNQIDVFIRLLESLCGDSFTKLQKIDLDKRTILFDCIANLCKPLKKSFKRILNNQTWDLVCEYTETLAQILTTDFTRKPLEFARQAQIYKEMPDELELELIQLIEQMRKKHPHLLNDILEEEYREIQKLHRDNFVITVVGSTKSTKSSLINFLLEEEICPTGNQPTTARLTRITYGSELSVTLIKSSAERSQKYIFSNLRRLVEKARELIILKNEERKSQLCEDTVLIELPIEQLKHVELWDVPGYDENRIINQRIEEILKKTDLILAVLAQQETLRQTTIDLIKSSLNSRDEKRPVTKICFIISQIDRFKSDSQTHETRETFLQHLYDKICEELPTNFPRIDYHLCHQFIPMCTSSTHNPKDYLQCREDFLSKSSQWFKQALTHLTRQRSEYLLKSIKEFSNYENLVRQKIRYNRTKEIFNQHFQVFSEKLTDEVNDKFHEINLFLKQSIDETVQAAKSLFYNDATLDSIEDDIQKRIAIGFRNVLTLRNVELIEMISDMSIHFSSTIELKPPEIQILKQVLNQTLTSDYYLDIIEQYHHTSPYHLSAYFSRIAYALSETLKATLSIPLGNFQRLKRACEQFIRRETFVEETTTNSLTTLVTELIEFISEKLQQKTERTLKDILTQQLIRISQDIDFKAQKYLHSPIDHMKIDYIRQFYTDNTLKITRIHLDILDLQFQLDYDLDYQVHLNQRLDDNSNYPVYAGILNNKSIAAKLIRLKDFKLQEVLYIRELKHSNVIKYYGVKKEQNDHYYIFMPRLDCNLHVYLQEYAQRLDPTAIDQMIVQIVEGLNYIHTQLELIHRDIKLENILVNKTKRRFLIADLGGVHRQPITRIYTDDYAPPELFSNNNPTLITEKFDIYSLGIVIKKIIQLSEVQQVNKGWIKFWKNLSESCCSEKSTERPSCQLLLEKRLQYTAQS